MVKNSILLSFHLQLPPQMFETHKVGQVYPQTIPKNSFLQHTCFHVQGCSVWCEQSNTAFLQDNWHCEESLFREAQACI